MERMRAPRGGALALLFASVWLGGTAFGQATEQSSGVSEVRLRPGQVPRAEDFETARTIGAGLGMRAGAYGSTAVVVNPANLTLGRIYHMEAFTQYSPREGGFAFGSVVVDSSTNRIRAGVATRALLGDGERNYRGSDNRLALGTALGDKIGIGLSLRYLRLVSRGATSDGYPSALETRAITMDAALA